MNPPPTARCIRYSGGYKYQLRQEHVDRTRVTPDAPARIEYVALEPDGTIVIRRGYAWDGPSGPSIDTPSFMRGSLVHDALYQLMRVGVLEPSIWRDVADRELRRLCREDGMSWIRSLWVYLGVRWFGASASTPRYRRPVETAPRSCPEPPEE